MLRRAMMAGAASAPSAYTTLNPADKAAKLALSGGNLIATTVTPNSGIVRAVHGKSSGKWYFEALVEQVDSTAADNCAVGLCTAAHGLSSALGYTSASGWALWGWGGSGFRNGALVLAASMLDGDVVGFSVDLDNDRMWVSINGAWIQGDPSAGTSPLSLNLSGAIYPAACPWKDNRITMRFDPAHQTYAAPSGFTAGWTASP